VADYDSVTQRERGLKSRNRRKDKAVLCGDAVTEDTIRGRKKKKLTNARQGQRRGKKRRKKKGKVENQTETGIGVHN